MRKASFLIGTCLILALALNVMAFQQQRSHPEIMQDVRVARPALAEAIEAGNATEVAMQAEKLEGLFNEVGAIYDSMNLAPAKMIADKAAAAAAETAAAAKANNMDAAGTAGGMVGTMCKACHSQFRAKADDGSFRIKTD